MVLQPDTGALQIRCIADTGHLQQLRRLESACGKNDLLAIGDMFHAILLEYHRLGPALRDLYPERQRPVRTSRFSRCLTGRRKASALEQRMPFLIVAWVQPAPSGSPAQKSSVSGI